MALPPVVLTPQLVASNQPSSEILGILAVAVGAEAVRRHQVEVAAPKSVRAAPHKPLRNPIDQLRSWQVAFRVVRIVVEVKILLQVPYQVLAAIFNWLLEV